MRKRNYFEVSVVGRQDGGQPHPNASYDSYHDDHGDTKQCPVCWETAQLGSHVDWWMEDSITGQQQPSGIKVHHCNDWWWLRVADRKVTLIVR